MKEIYRSFNEKLGVDNQRGYIVRESSDFYEVEFLSVWTEDKKSLTRVSKNVKCDFKNLNEVLEILGAVENLTVDGQIYYEGKWYSTEKIKKLQEKHCDYNWRKYTK